MFKQLDDLPRALVFYGLAFGLALVVAITGGSTALYMLTPLVAVVLMMLVVTRDGYSRAGWARLGLHRPGVRAWPAAVLVPLAVMTFAYGTLWATGALEFRTVAEINGQRLPLALAPLEALATILIASLTLSLGEELGWRGYLLPHLATLGTRRAAVLSGLLHACWHLPLILLTTLYHADGNRLIVLPLFVATVTVAGMFFGYLRLSTNSVWPASLAHSVHNELMNLFPAFAVFASPLANEYFAGDSGLLVAIGYATLGGWLLYRLGRKASARRLQVAAEVA